MTDITPTLNQLLAVRSCNQAGKTLYSFDRVNEFLREAQQIHTRTTELLDYLRSIKRPYLSTAPPSRQVRLLDSSSSSSRHDQSQSQSQSPHQIHLTNNQRDAIDAEAKTTHRDISAAITRLAQAEKVRADTEIALTAKRRRKRGFGALGAWAAGDAVANGTADDEGKTAEEAAEDGRLKCVKACREAVLWFLGRELEVCGRTQSEMMEIRIRREVEKSKGVLSRVGGDGSNNKTGSSPGTLLSPSSASPVQDYDQLQLSTEQQQLFATENHDLLKHYEDRASQIRGVESSVLEISSLQSQLAISLDQQSAAIEQLVSDSFTTAQDVAQGNKELKKASERRSLAKAAFRATCVGCAVFVVWDLLI